MSQELLVELRCEELPPSMVRPALAALRDGLVGLLDGLSHGEPRVYATPRRLAVIIPDVAEARPVVERVVTGPSAERAFKDGEPTRAALGFARGKGIDVADLEIIETARGRVVGARVREGGERAADLVVAGLDAVVRGLPFKKSMEWGDGGLEWGRPLHGVLATFGGQLLSGRAAGLPLVNVTEGHRFEESPAFQANTGAEWLDGCRAHHVEPDLDARAARIRALLDEAAAELGADPIVDDDLAEQVLHLTEWPVKVVSQFDEPLLHLPPRLLITSMKVHQRYFPVHRDSVLTNHFVAIANSPWGDQATMANGFARVLRARFYDARFFFAEDQKSTLEQHGVELEKMQWIRGLSTMAAKQRRIADLAARLAPLVDADPNAARRAGELCKCDLATQMVGEFADLQGHMGKLYAIHDGESEAVAIAIEEHYRPAFADDEPASSAAGIAVALAERLDTLVGCFGIGMKPRGGDPQGLRRGASGIVKTLAVRGLRLELGELFGIAFDVFDGAATDDTYGKWAKASPDRAAIVTDLVAFSMARFRAGAISQGTSADLVDAVLSSTPPTPVVLQAKISALGGMAGTSEFVPIMHTFKRVLNISRGSEAADPDPASFTEPAESALWTAVEAVDDDVARAADALDYAGALHKVMTLAGPVATLFDDVLIEDPDPAIKERRLGLLFRVSRVFLRVADFSRVSTR